MAAHEVSRSRHMKPVTPTDATAPLADVARMWEAGLRHLEAGGILGWGGGQVEICFFCPGSRASDARW